MNDGVAIPSTGSKTAPARDRRHALIAVAATIAILVAVPILVVTYRPSWTLRPLVFATPGEDLGAISWSPDGTRLLFAGIDQFVVFRLADRARLATARGTSPVWVDDDTIDAIDDIGLERSQVVRVSVAGRVTSESLPPILPTARLVGEGPLDLAATENVGSIWTKVLDPRTGRVIADLPDVRATAWAATGRLIAKSVERSGLMGQLPGHLRSWTARDGLRPIGGDLLEIAEVVSVTPARDAIVCRCALETEDRNTEGSIYVVPLDGSAPRKLFDLTRGDMNIQTNFGWLPDGSLIVLDGVGFHRFALDGTPLGVPSIAAADLPTPKYAGRAYVLGGELVLGSQLGSSPTGEARLTIRGLDGDVVLGRTLPSWNGLGLMVDHDRPRALVLTDPQRPGEPSGAYFVLERS